MSVYNVLSQVVKRPLPKQLPGRTRLLFNYIFVILPQVKKLLGRWENAAGNCTDIGLREQALASLRLKDFHCQGGSVFAVLAEERQAELLSFIVAYQTICDYLDNLCDRAGETDGRAFLRLHQSLLAALDSRREHLDYYEYFSAYDDGGYLLGLIEECRRCLQALPSYELVKEESLTLANWYTGLQVNKHLDWGIREKSLVRWVSGQLLKYPELYWNEWAAASGSTLAIFALMRLACKKDLKPAMVQEARQSYFPYICALHILLDYLIDQEEDRQGSDLNFIFYYHQLDEAVDRIKWLIRESRKRITDSDDSDLDTLVIEGLLAMYLSDSKVARQGFSGLAGELIKECGGSARRVFHICALVRRFL